MPHACWIAPVPAYLAGAGQEGAGQAWQHGRTSEEPSKSSGFTFLYVFFSLNILNVFVIF